jgi:hypothetical protein
MTQSLNIVISGITRNLSQLRYRNRLKILIELPLGMKMLSAGSDAAGSKKTGLLG